ncbi:MAG: phosphotransferase family protein [Porticoccaceae bacterium]
MRSANDKQSGAASQGPLSEIFNRDLDQAAVIVRNWLADRIPGCSELRLDEVVATGGLSNELIIVEASWREGSESRKQGFVLRIDPVNYRKRPSSNLRREFDVLNGLYRHSDVPVPKPFWYEEDSSLLGAEFFAMERLYGQIPADRPPYQLEGWVVELAPQQRAQLWRSAIETLAKIHRAPVDKLTKLKRGDPALGDFENHVDYWHQTYQWAMDGVKNPLSDEAWVWLRNNFPDDAPRGLSWGDARLGNMMFNGTQCCGVLDWEDVALSSPLVDLGRWLFADAFHKASGYPPLEGFGDRSATLELWEACTGYSTRHVRWFEIFTIATGIGLVARMGRLQAEIAGKLVGPQHINIEAFNKILVEWLESV